MPRRKELSWHWLVRYPHKIWQLTSRLRTLGYNSIGKTWLASLLPRVRAISCVLHLSWPWVQVIHNSDVLWEPTWDLIATPQFDIVLSSGQRGMSIYLAWTSHAFPRWSNWHYIAITNLCTECDLCCFESNIFYRWMFLRESFSDQVLSFFTRKLKGNYHKAFFTHSWNVQDCNWYVSLRFNHKGDLKKKFFNRLQSQSLKLPIDSMPLWLKWNLRLGRSLSCKTR